MLDFKDDPVPAYENDFILWLESQVALLRAGGPRNQTAVQSLPAALALQPRRAAG